METLNLEDLILEDDELTLVNATRQAEEANFENRLIDERPGAVIRADIIRRLMLGLPIILRRGEAPTTIDVPGPGIRLVHAHVTGDLILNYGCMGNGEELPRLSMESCYIPGVIGLRSARLRRLCLHDSWVNLVIAHQAYISGQLDIRGVKSAGVRDGAQGRTLCRFGLRGAHIEDGIDARRAVLVSAPAREGYVKYATRARYALDLAEARIEGDVRLFPDFEAYGGVNINGAQVKGSIQAHGAIITSEEMYAFDVSNAQVEGRIALDTRQAENKGNSVRFHGVGEFCFFNANLSANLNMAGAQIDGKINAALLKTQGDILFCAYGGHKDGKPALIEFGCSGPINLRGARIGGSLICEGGQLDSELDASNTQIQCHAQFGPHHLTNEKLHMRFLTLAPLILEGTHIAGNLNLEGAHLRAGLNAKGVHIDGYCKMGFHSDTQNYHFESKGLIELNDAYIGFDLDMSGAHITDELIAPNIQIGGKLKLCAVDGRLGDAQSEKRFVADKKIDLSGAQIKSSFYLYGATLKRGLRFRGGLVKSSLIILDLEGGTKDNIGTLADPVTVNSTIDLINAHANIVSDFYDGELQYGTRFTLKLEGFTYDRFKEREDIESLTESEGGWLKRKWQNEVKRDSERKWADWLDMQYEMHDGKRRAKKDTYSPDAYNTLFMTMKRNGQLELADKVLAQKLRTENRFKPWYDRVILFFYDLLFLFGLSPIRASLWYGVYVAIIGLAIFYANSPTVHQSINMSWTHSVTDIFHMTEIENLPIDWVNDPVLIVRAEPQSGIRALLSRASIKTDDFFDTNQPKGSYLPEVPCGDRINPALYAIDMIVPVIDLNQKSRCDFSPRSGLIWQIFKAVATILGWIMTSLVILTWSGVIRRRTEPVN